MTLFDRFGGGFSATLIVLVLGIGAALFSGVLLMFLMSWRPDGPMLYMLASLAGFVVLGIGIEIWDRTRRSR
jgi:hypothetical protein